MKKYLVILSLFMVFGCSEEEPVTKDFPVIVTLGISDIDESGATFRGEVTNSGTGTTTSYGFVWSTSDPNVEESEMIVLGEQVKNGTFEIRIDYSLIEGLQYEVRAFAILQNRIVYGNVVTFDSQGSSKEPWTLKSQKVRLDGYDFAVGSAGNQLGYVAYHSSQHVYVYNPDENTFSSGPEFPVGASLGESFISASTPNAQYYISPQIRRAYKFENETWELVTGIPFNMRVSTYHALAYNEKLFFFSTSENHVYNLQSEAWEDITEIPQITGDRGTVISHTRGVVLVGNKAFVLTSDKRLLEYDLENDSWETRTTYPGVLRTSAVSFSHDNKVYFGLSIGNGIRDRALWEFDLATDTWRSKQPLPNDAVQGERFAFFLKGKLYLGQEKSSYTFDLWAFDPKVAD